MKPTRAAPVDTLIIGGKHGIGKDFARLLDKRCVTASISEDLNDPHHYKLDLRNDPTIIINRILQRYPHIRHLYWISAQRPLKLLKDMSSSDITDYASMHLKSLSIVINLFLSHLKDKRNGFNFAARIRPSITLVGSKCGMKGFSRGVMYSASKSWMMTYFDSLLEELHSENTRVNIIIPGSFSTEKHVITNPHTYGRVLRVLMKVRHSNMNNQTIFLMTLRERVTLIKHTLRRLLKICTK